MARADRDIDNRRGAGKDCDKRAGKTVAHAPASESERAAPQGKSHETRSNPHQRTGGEPEKSDETPNQTLYELRAQSRADTTIHMIRADVAMSQAADMLSPTTDKILEKTGNYTRSVMTGTVRTRACDGK